MWKHKRLLWCNRNKIDGKEITVTLEDALFSAKSMAIMFGNGTVADYNWDKGDDAGALIMKTEQFVATAENAAEEGITDNSKPTSKEWTPITITKPFGWDEYFTAPDGKRYPKLNPKFYDATGAQINLSKEKQIKPGERYFCSYDLAVDGAIIDISANSFPGTLTDRVPLWGNTNQFGELLEAVA